MPSTLRVALSPLVPPTEPTLSFRTGLVSHFFSVLTERREPGEFGAELPDAWGGKEATDVEILPSLPAAEYESTHTNTQGERQQSSERMSRGRKTNKAALHKHGSVIHTQPQTTTHSCVTLNMGIKKLLFSVFM